MGCTSFKRRKLLKSALLSAGVGLAQQLRLSRAAVEPGVGAVRSVGSDLLSKLHSPVLFRGDESTAYRDPAAVYVGSWFYLYFTLVKVEADEKAYMYTAWSRSRDLRIWSEVQRITPRDQNLNFSSPGDIVRFDGSWVMCLQTYPRPHGIQYGNQDCRIWTMRSHDLMHWEQPILLRVKGPQIPRKDMGRIIDPYLLEDKDHPRKWWCFYKQNGINLSSSFDLENWKFERRIVAGENENPAIIVDKGEYVLFYSPENGIGVKRSRDLIEWRNEGILTLGQSQWPWAKGRLTAGFVLDLRYLPGIGKAVMFFHGSDYQEDDPRGGFDKLCSIGIAWSEDLKNWEWPAVSKTAAVSSKNDQSQKAPEN